MLDWLMFWKAPKREQQCLVLREDRSIDKIRMTIEKKGYVSDKAKFSTWYLIHRLLLPLQGSKKLSLLISERDAVPLDPFRSLNENDLKKLANVSPLAEEAANDHLSKVEQQWKKDALAQAIRFSVTLIAIIFAIVAIMALKGKIQLPF